MEPCGNSNYVTFADGLTAKAPPTAHSLWLVVALLFFAVCLTRSAGAAPEPGPRVGQLGRKEALEFVGNDTFASHIIWAGLRANLRFQLAAHPAAPLPDYLKALEEMVLEGYRRCGFNEPRVAVVLKTDRSGIVITINEGTRFKVGEVHFKGAPAIADHALQAKLLLALAGVVPAENDIDKPGTNVLRAAWTKGSYAPFDTAALGDLKTALIEEFGRQKFYRPGLKLEVVPNPAVKTADLVVDLLDEGMKGAIEEFVFDYPGKLRVNTDAEMMGFLGLKQGMPFTEALLKGLNGMLKDSGRFYRHGVMVEPLPAVGKFKLVFELEDLEGAPPLRVPLAPHERVLLNLCRRLNELDKHQDDLVISLDVETPKKAAQKPLKADLVLSGSGVAVLVRSSGSNNPPRVLYSAVFSEHLEFHSGWRQRSVRYTGSNTLNIRPFFHVLPDEKSGVEQKFTMSMGAGVGATTTDRAVEWSLDFTPAAFLHKARERAKDLTISNGVLHGSFDAGVLPRTRLRIEAETGRLLEASFSEKTNQMVVDFNMRFETGGFSRLQSEIASLTKSFPNEYQPEFPLSSFLGFFATDVFESGALESPLVVERGLEKKTPEQREAWINLVTNIRSALEQMKSALGKQSLAECLNGLEAEIRDAFLALKQGPAGECTDPFIVPVVREPGVPDSQTFLGLIGAAFVNWSDSLWSRGLWPWVLTREAGFTLANQGKYTSFELQRLLGSDDMGPVGRWAAATLLAKVNAPLSESFVLKGLAQLSPDTLQHDLQVLLNPEALAGNLALKGLRRVSSFGEAQIAGIAKALSPETAQFLQEMSRTIRAATNQPPAEALAPLLSRYWEPVLKPTLERELKSLLAKVGTPADPEGAFTRACFIMQSGGQPGQVEKARDLFRFAAEKGHAPSQMELGRMYQEGIGSGKDPVEALKWYLLAAEQALPHAGCRVADMYANGMGVEKNPARALEWYLKDAQLGCSRSQLMMGRLLEGQSKTAEALDWYRQAATNGLVPAQVTLGERLSDGFTVKADYFEAYLWYGLAAEHGDRVAAVSARRLKSKLSDAQLQEAAREINRLFALQDKAAKKK